MKLIFARLSNLCNKQFLLRFLCRWIFIFIILSLCAWLFFLRYDIEGFDKPIVRGLQNGTTSGLLSLISLPAVLTTSMIIALLHTREDRKRNYPRMYWLIWIIPILPLSSVDYYYYRFYRNLITPVEINKRQSFETEVSRGDTNYYIGLADMYKNGEGGSKEPQKAKKLYQKLCDAPNKVNDVNNLTINACTEIKEYTKLRLMLMNSHFSDHMVVLGNLYEKGLGGPKDIKKAKELYKQACEDRGYYECKYYIFTTKHFPF